MNDSGNFSNNLPGTSGGNNRTWLYIVIGVAVVCILCVAGVGILGLIGIKVLPSLVESGGGDVQVTTSQYVESVTMAREVSGEEMNPVNPTTVFSPTDTVHAVVRIVDAPADTEFKATWQVVDVGGAADAGDTIDETELKAQGNRNLDFSLTPNNQWPVGTYRVEIYVNGDLAQTADYSVE